MKKVLVAFCLFFCSDVFAVVQKDTIIHIDSLGQFGYQLNKGWKFNTDDDPAFSRTDYDDKNWQNINPALKRRDLPKDAQQGIGWLRIHFKVAPALRQNALIQVSSFAAAEIYMDGKLIARRGTIAPRLKTGRGYVTLDPIELSLTNDSIHTLAIRYAQETNIVFFTGAPTDQFMGVLFTDTQHIINGTKADEIIHFMMGICISILSLLTLIHFSLFYYNPGKKANFYIAGYTFLYAVTIFIILCIGVSSLYYDTIIYINMLWRATALASGIWFIKALYTLFDFKAGRFYKSLIIVSAASWLIHLFAFGLYPFWAAMMLISVVELWLAVKALHLKKRGAFIVAAGLLSELVGIFVFVYLLINPVINDYWRGALFLIAFGLTVLSPAFAMSLFLSREFALDGRLLKLKLEQVEELSAQTIAQEQETQQILANQNALLETQVTERTAELNQSLTNLKATQTQLIQSEKMASLGELTAGIAHEIQNPLNFVNNFSEVNQEMLAELDEELSKGDVEEARAIAADIRQNEAKINHHGKRADAIVKGMLQHSQTGSGTKEPTNMNALAEECMRLSYHGLRAKDKSFNAELVTHFDETLPIVNVIPQDMVRVMLNLFNNAYYAVSQKQKTSAQNFKPEVSLSTTSENGSIVIAVKDNGTGIPEAIKEKIMQPFFTTKPTGEGTGLGLSLTYDMVVKGHGGSIRVNSIEGQGAEFIVTLSIK